MRVLVVAVLLLFTGAAHAALELDRGRTLDFAAVEDARRLLGVRDDFVARLSPFDRAARLKSAQPVDEKRYLEFVARSVRAWTPAEQQRIAAALESIRARLLRYGRAIPAHVDLVKTDGSEEGGAAYTRGRTVVFPQGIVDGSTEELADTLAHELFHVLSRNDAKLREQAYAAIGFVPCPEVALPGALEPRRITNPDAPRNDHRIRLQLDGKPVWAVPVLYADAERYDEKRGGAFFDYLVFRMLLVDERSRPLQPRAEDALVALGKLTGFDEQVGKNTDYVIHPEEILAVNFALLVRDKKPLASPAIPERLAAILEHSNLE
jgi:hypothetical protein